jgi:hypothetical protein
MRLTPVAMASVQASRFSSSPSTPAQAPPAIQARTGQLVFAPSSKIKKFTKSQVMGFLGPDFEAIIAQFQNLHNFDIQVVPGKGKITVGKFGYRLVPKNTNPKYNPNQDLVAFLQPVQFEAQKHTQWVEALLSTVKKENSRLREKAAQQKRREKMANKATPTR